MSGFLAGPWTASRVRFTGADPVLALVIVPEVIVPLARLGASATDPDLGRRFVTDTAGLSVQIGVHRHVAVRGRVIVGRGGHAGRRGRADDDDAILIVIIGGNRGHGRVIGEPMGLVSVIGSGIGVGVTGSDVTAEGSLPDHQNAASRLQHHHLPHPRPFPSSLLPAVTDEEGERAQVARELPRKRSSFFG